MWTALLIALTCICAITIIVLIFRSDASATRDLDMDLDAYKAQLRHIQRDVANGTISRAEGDLSTRDIHRRILAASRRHESALIDRDIPRSVRWVATVLTGLLLVPGTLLLLQVSGYRHMLDMPVAERIEQARMIRTERPGQAEYIESFGPANETSERGLTDEQTALLEEFEDDSVMLEELAIGQAQSGHYHAATVFQGRAIDLLDHDALAPHHTRMAAYLVAEAGGYVSHEAEMHLVAALAHNPGDVRARYISGLLDIQTGRPDLGYRRWVSILEAIPSDDPIGEQIREALPYAAYAAGIEHLANHQQIGMMR